MARSPVDDEEGAARPRGLFDDDEPGLRFGPASDVPGGKLGFEESTAQDRLPGSPPPPARERPLPGMAAPPARARSHAALRDSDEAATRIAEARSARPARPEQPVRPEEAPAPSPAPSPRATRMMRANEEVTRISAAHPAHLLREAAMAAGPAPASPAPASRTPTTPAPAQRAPATPPRKGLFSGDAATRITRPDAAAPAPAWRPTDVPRAQAAPNTLAWDKEDSAILRAGAALRALAGGKRARAPSAPPAAEVEVRVDAIPFFQGVPAALIESALAVGSLAVVRRGRDALLDVGTAALLLVEGQVSLAHFARDWLAAEWAAQRAVAPGDKKAAKREARRRVEAGPLIGLATQNVAFFERGDLVHLRDASAGETVPGVYSVTPIVGVAVAPSLLEQLQRGYPFFADRLRRASTAARSRIEAVGGARADVADFFIRHGLSVSQVLRVRAIDQCIECGQCEAACEERYGAKRLSLNGKVLGTLDFVDACHTCTDQRCIDPCAFDAIQYDTEKREIVIIEAACTGCTLCATACPYAAIEMHDLADRPLLQLRLESQGKLGFGDGAPAIATQFGSIAPRKAKLKRIASKCDHCIDYGDQACISACPTGALFDVAPGDVFQTRSSQITAQADDGYDHSRILNVAELNDPRLFKYGLKAGEAEGLDRARAARGEVRTRWMWMVGLGAWLCALVEIGLRALAPSFSIDYLAMRFLDGLDPDIALDRVDFHAGSLFALRLGYLGSVLTYSGFLYPLRKRVPALKNLGSWRVWFDAHVLTGVCGPLFVALHTASRFDNWVTLAVLAMALTSATGLAGRYLFTQIPEWASAAALEASDAEGALSPIRSRHPGVRALDNWFHAERGRIQEVAARTSPRIALWLLGQFFGRALRRRDLVARVQGVVDPAARREAVRASLLLARAERHRVLLPKLEPLARRWKPLHLIAASMLVLLGGAHIVLALIG